MWNCFQHATQKLRLFNSFIHTSTSKVNMVNLKPASEVLIYEASAEQFKFQKKVGYISFVVICLSGAMTINAVILNKILKKERKDSFVQRINLLAPYMAAFTGITSLVFGLYYPRRAVKSIIALPQNRVVINTYGKFGMNSVSSILVSTNDIMTFKRDSDYVYFKIFPRPFSFNLSFKDSKIHSSEYFNSLFKVAMS